MYRYILNYPVMRECKIWRCILHFNLSLAPLGLKPLIPLVRVLQRASGSHGDVSVMHHLAFSHWITFHKSVIWHFNKTEYQISTSCLDHLSFSFTYPIDRQGTNVCAPAVVTRWLTEQPWWSNLWISAIMWVASRWARRSPDIPKNHRSPALGLSNSLCFWRNYSGLHVGFGIRSHAALWAWDVS